MVPTAYNRASASGRHSYRTFPICQPQHQPHRQEAVFSSERAPRINTFTINPTHTLPSHLPLYGPKIPRIPQRWLPCTLLWAARSARTSYVLPNALFNRKSAISMPRSSGYASAIDCAKKERLGSLERSQKMQWAYLGVELNIGLTSPVTCSSR
jgi:hypothetical protein